MFVSESTETGREGSGEPAPTSRKRERAEGTAGAKVTLEHRQMQPSPCLTRCQVRRCSPEETAALGACGQVGINVTTRRLPSRSLPPHDERPLRARPSTF